MVGVVAGLAVAGTLFSVQPSYRMTVGTDAVVSAEVYPLASPDQREAQVSALLQGASRGTDSIQTFPGGARVRIVGGRNAEGGGHVVLRSLDSAPWLCRISFRPHGTEDNVLAATNWCLTFVVASTAPGARTEPEVEELEEDAPAPPTYRIVTPPPILPGVRSQPTPPKPVAKPPQAARSPGARPRDERPRAEVSDRR